MIFQEKCSSCQILVTDQILLPGCLSFLMYWAICVLVQWPSQGFKGHFDIDYIWVFISFYVSAGIGGPEKPHLLFPSVGQTFLWCIEGAASVVSSRNFQKLKQLSKHSIVWSHFRANCMQIQKMTPLMCQYTFFKNCCGNYYFFAILADY